jgi:hypothetical protein
MAGHGGGGIVQYHQRHITAVVHHIQQRRHTVMEES